MSVISAAPIKSGANLFLNILFLFNSCGYKVLFKDNILTTLVLSYFEKSYSNLVVKHLLQPIGLGPLGIQVRSGTCTSIWPASRLSSWDIPEGLKRTLPSGLVWRNCRPSDPTQQKFYNTRSWEFRPFRSIMDENIEIAGVNTPLLST